MINFNTIQEDLDEGEKAALELICSIREIQGRSLPPQDCRMMPSVRQLLPLFESTCSSLDKKREEQHLSSRDEGTFCYLISILESNGICERTLFRTISIKDLKDYLDTLPEEQSIFSLFNSESTKQALKNYIKDIPPEASIAVEGLKICRATIKKNLQKADKATLEIFREIDKRADVPGAHHSKQANPR